MEITLRKAHAIQPEIRRAIKDVQEKGVISITEYTEDIEYAITDGSLTFQQGMLKKERLTHALYNIRNAVAEANASAGVPELLGTIERIDDFIKIFQTISDLEPAKTISEIKARLEKIKGMKEESRLYGRYDTVETTVVNKDNISLAKTKVKQLRKEKQSVQDKLLHINVNTFIKLGEEDFQVLSEEGII